MKKKLLKEDVQTFLGRIPTVLKLKGDEIIKNILTNGSAGAITYSFIDDVKIASKGSLEKSLDLIAKNLPENPTAEELEDSEKQIAIVKNRVAEGQDTPKTNTFDYITEKLAEIHGLPEGGLISGMGEEFAVTPDMKSNIVQGLTTMYDVQDPAGVFKAFLIGGKKSSRKGTFRPKLPRFENNNIDWEYFDIILGVLRVMISTEDTIKSQLAAYSVEEEGGSFSSMFMALASKRYISAIRAIKAKNRESNPDNALFKRIKQDDGVFSIDKKIGDGGATFASELADTADTSEEAAQMEVDMNNAFSELKEWLRNNRVEGEIDSQIWQAGFSDGLKTNGMVDNPKYPALTSQNMSRLSTPGKAHFDYPSKLMTALRVGRFPSVFKRTIKKHLPHINVEFMDTKGFSLNINKIDTPPSTAPSIDDTKYPDMSTHEMQYYKATGELPSNFYFKDNELEKSNGETETPEEKKVRQFYLDNPDLKPDGDDLDRNPNLELLDPDLFEGLLQERVVRRVSNLIAESLYRRFLTLEV